MELKVDPNILNALTSDILSEPVSANNGDGDGNDTGNSSNTWNGNASEGNSNGNSGAAPVNLNLPESFYSAFGISAEDIKVDENGDPVQKIAEVAKQKIIDSLPPLAKFVYEHANDPSFDPKEFAQKIAGNTQQLSPQQKVHEYLYEKFGGKYDEKNNPNGLTDDDIKEYLSGKTKIELKELERSAEEHFSSKKGEPLTEYEKYLAQKNEEYFNALITLQQENAKRILEGSKQIKSIYGLEIDESEKTEFNKVFSELITPKKETGLAPLLEMIYSMDDAELYKLAYILWAKEPTLAEKVNFKVTSSKKKIIEKLEGGSMRRSTHTTGTSDGIDITKLSMPER